MNKMTDEEMAKEAVKHGLPMTNQWAYWAQLISFAREIEERAWQNMEREVIEEVFAPEQNQESVGVQACREEDRSILQTDAGRELVKCAVDAIKKESAASAVAAWQPIETAPRGELIHIWITDKPILGRRWGEAQMWAYCYYDSICDEWRTTRPSGHLRTVPARYVTHWMALLAAPTEAKSEPSNDWPEGNYTNKCSGCSCLFTGPKNAPLCYVCMPKGEVGQ